MLAASGHVLVEASNLENLLYSTDEDTRAVSSSDFDQTLMLLRRPAQITRVVYNEGSTIVTVCIASWWILLIYFRKDK